MQPYPGMYLDQERDDFSWLQTIKNEEFEVLVEGLTVVKTENFITVFAVVMGSYWCLTLFTPRIWNQR